MKERKDLEGFTEEVMKEAGFGRWVGVCQIEKGYHPEGVGCATNQRLVENTVKEAGMGQWL